jgi:alpha-beta hydrolase superfamily lysophospholipase
MKQAFPTVFISRIFKVLLLSAVLITLSGCERFLFYPMKPWARTPAQLGIEYEDVEIVTADGTRLSAWWLDARGEVQGTVVFFHGNAENISTHLGSVYWLPERGYQVLMVDYRGYGSSQGRPGLPEVFEDIKATLEKAYGDPRVAGKPIFMLGQSLGAAMSGYVVATNPALNKPLDAVVLDAAFASYPQITREVASRHWLTWSFQYPASWTMPRKYNLVDHIAQISPTPVLIIHGTQDQIIPFTNGEILFSAARDPKNFLQYDGPHIETFRDLELRQMMLDFFAKSVQRREVDTQGQ